MRIRFLRLAEQDITTAIDWYRERSPIAAERFANDIDAAVGKIAADPERFPRWDDRHKFLLLRRFPYYVAFRVETDHALIVAVRHASLGTEEWSLRQSENR